MSAHPKLRAGRALDDHRVEDLFSYDPVLRQLDETLTAAGYVRQPNVQPRVRTDRRLSVKVVWRNKLGDSVTRCARFEIIGA